VAEADLAAAPAALEPPPPGGGGGRGGRGWAVLHVVSDGGMVSA